ncbi:MAG: transcription elongation factor GreA [Alphaproteobacteria bacterium GM7ARS4]|nr:transcription elongation factor GreA [Alphaproteobacteria bacterium GM7ARS4]
MTETYPMTRRGYERLQEELGHLKNTERPNIVDAISRAREHGDLSENAEYHAAREKQGLIEARIRLLEQKIRCADVIDTASLSGKTVTFGATVIIRDEESGKEQRYKIVGEDEANVEKQEISIISPLARALLNKTVGDAVEVHTPRGSKEYEVIHVSFDSSS